MKIYGAVNVDGLILNNEDIANLNPDYNWVYGLHWVYAGDQGFSEANIYAKHGSEEFCEGGRNALNMFLQWHNEQLVLA